jgi:[ribosomal protein S5]-alanine N-acetyltransferase
MEISLERCHIRSWRADDAARLAAIANDRSIWIMVRDRFPHPYTLADAEAFIARVGSEVPECNFAITVNDVPVGCVGFVPGEDIARVSAEVGYWLGADARGRGLASEAVRGFVQWLWATTEFHHLFAKVFTSNPASARVLEKAGFTRAHVARKAAIKDGELRDEWHLVLVRGDEEAGASTH